MIETHRKLREDELNPADKTLLGLLREGRITAAYAARVTEYTPNYIHDRLRRLVEHGHVENLYEYQGLYELTDDPREE